MGFSLQNPIHQVANAFALQKPSANSPQQCIVCRLLIGLRIPAEEIASPFFERPYYLIPEDEFATEGYQVIHAALKKESV
jgi:hypothetical protein